MCIKTLIFVSHKCVGNYLAITWKLLVCGCWSPDAKFVVAVKSETATNYIRNIISTWPFCLQWKHALLGWDQTIEEHPISLFFLIKEALGSVLGVFVRIWAESTAPTHLRIHPHVESSPKKLPYADSNSIWPQKLPAGQSSSYFGASENGGLHRENGCKLHKLVNLCSTPRI